MTKWVLIFFVFLFASLCNAANVVGADIYYKLLKNNKVEVSVKRYTLQGNKDTQNIKIGIKIGNYIFNQTSNKASTRILSTFCNRYTNSNMYSFDEVREELFNTTFDLSSNFLDSLIQKNCEVKFFYFNSSRQISITNFDGSKKMYIESMANLCSLKNEIIYPSFNNAPLFSPCCNMAMIYNFGYVNQPSVIDSFSFELVNVKDSIGRDINYASSFSKKIPMSPYCPPNPGKIDCKPLPNAKPPRGFYFNEILGDLVFAPTNCEEVGVICVKINLYKLDQNNTMRNIGYITREMTLSVKQCADNNPAQITNATNYYKVCEGNEICIKYSSIDDPYLPNQKKLDTTTLTFNQNNTNATFKVIDTNAREKEANLCWQTKYGDGRYVPYHFTIKANDSFCPVNGSSSKGLLIKVMKDPTWKKRKYKFVVCNKMELQLDKSNYTSVEWKVYNENNFLIATSNKFTDTVQLTRPFTSKYYIKCIVNNDNICTNNDTIYNTKFDSDYISYIDTNICQTNNSINLDNFNIYKNNKARWYDVYDSLITNKVINIKNYSFPYVLQATYKLSQPSCYIQNNYTFFIHDTLKKRIDNLDICNNSNSLKLFEKGFYKRNKGLWSVSPYSVIDSLGILNYSKANKMYNVKYYYDSGYCRNYDQLFINVEPLSKSNFKADITSGTPSLLVSFTNQTIGSNLKYKWNFGDKYSSSNSSLIMNPAHYYDSIGKYSVSLISKGNVCIDTLIKTDFIEVKAKSLGIKGMKAKDLGIKVFPNPSNGIVNIENKNNYQLIVTDIAGRVIVSPQPLSTGERLTIITLPKGIYFFRFVTDGCFVNEKVVVL